MSHVYYGNMRAKDWSEWPDTDSLYLEPKLDGYRLSTMVMNGACTFFCRDEDPVDWSPNLEHVKESILRVGFKDCMLDGEIMAKNWNETGIIRSGVSKKGYTPPSSETMSKIRNEIQYHVFDLVEFKSLTLSKVPGKRGEILIDPRTYETRKSKLRSMIYGDKHPTLKYVKGVYVENEDELTSAYNQFVQQGYEGAIAKDPKSPYVFDKHSAWMKLKPQTTVDLQIEDVVEGTGKYVGMFGAFICVNAKGQSIRVGIGFTDDDRRDLWKKRKSLVGKIIEVKAQESDVATARSPVFVRWRPDRKSL